MKLVGPIAYRVDGALIPPGIPVEVSDSQEAKRLQRLGFVECQTDAERHAQHSAKPTKSQKKRQGEG